METDKERRARRYKREKAKEREAMTDRAKIRAAAEKATPGEWRHMEDSGEVVFSDGKELAYLLSSGSAASDADHIANMDPATTLDLLDELDAQDKVVEAMAAALDQCEVSANHALTVVREVGKLYRELKEADDD